jgi:serine/threonine protein kinase
MTRPPAPPPQLPGYTYLRRLGGGGFADVFLYRQDSLDREVAIKVLLASASSPAERARFKNEGALMAKLSDAHANIVGVYDAAIGADGRPYLVMQYCPNPDMAHRCRTGSFTVAEVLSIGVQLAGAVESAHQQGILHRDIKPANVLTTASGKPALTDFGIAVTAADAADPDAVGVSIPWSPPELLAADPVGDVRSDVYSLTATLYTLLARRSPLEIDGRRTTTADLLARIMRVPAPLTGRPDTPQSLERVLARGLVKDPASRIASAEQLARALQDVQREMGVPITDLDFLSPNPERELADLRPEAADHTRVRPLVINAQGPATGQTRDSTRMRDVAQNRADPGKFDLPDGTVLRGRPVANAYSYLDPVPPTTPQAADTVVPPRPVPAPVAPTRRRGLRPLPLIVGVAVLAGAGVLTWIVVSGGTGIPAPDGTSTSSAAATNLAIDPTEAEAVVPAPADLAGTVTSDGVVFTCSNPAPRDGDSYSWTRTDAGAAATANPVSAPPITVSGASQACIEVLVVRDVGRASAHPAQACAGG